MIGYVFVAPGGLRTIAAVRRWTEEAIAFVATVPVKPARAKKPTKAGARRRPRA